MEKGRGGPANERAGTACSPGRRRRAIAAWLRLARFVSTQNASLGARLSAHHLSLAQFDVLAQIGAAEGLTQKELADRLVVTQGNVTQLLQKLELRRLVVRPQSGRCNRVSLTAAGRRLRSSLVPGQELAIARLFAPLTDAELETLSRVLRKITRDNRERTYIDKGARSPKGELT